ncbi:hypothetical protein F5X96DRAFT_685899 [Biscogniauxia mediterranea]|nr:hypothetical protein F5X96DRAFT_685899 [Biscogniauxia mediterranea]
MSASSSAPLPEERLTFGVELEFLIPALPVGKPDPREPGKRTCPLMRYPAEMTKDDNIGEYIVEQIRNVLKQIFEPPKKGLLASIFSIGKRAQFDDEFKAKILSTYSQWNAAEDVSVEEPEFQEYDWFSVEVQSPVDFSCEQAFKAITYATSEITKRYCCRVNPSTGFHVHVGQREERFALGAMRRIASLFWAAEPLLMTLQPPVRRVNNYCQSVRQRSNLALGTPVTPLHNNTVLGDPKLRPKACIRYLGRDCRFGEDPISKREMNSNVENVLAFEKTRLPGHYEPFHVVPGETSVEQLTTAGKQPDASEHIDQIKLRIAELKSKGKVPANVPREETRMRSGPRIEMPQYSVAELEALDKVASDYGVGGLSFTYGFAKKDIGVFEGVRQIFEAPSSCHIAELMGPHERFSLRIRGYKCLNTVRNIGLRTVEFRFGEGVMDSWAETMARICVGLVRFAIHSSANDFVDLLANCHVAAKEKGKYDVVDFIDDLGLFAEAQSAEQRIRRFQAEWGLKYVNPPAGTS